MVMIHSDYEADYAKFLERDLEAIEKTLIQLVLAHGEHKPIDSFIAEIEEWLGDDWHWDLSDEDQERCAKIKGWSYD